MVLKSAKHKERMAIVEHFRQEDEFKKSLSPSQKKKFDAEVNEAYENLLAECGIDKGSLQEWKEDAFRQGAESTVILEWGIGDYSKRKIESKPVSERAEKSEVRKISPLGKPIGGNGRRDGD